MFLSFLRKNKPQYPVFPQKTFSLIWNLYLEKVEAIGCQRGNYPLSAGESSNYIGGFPFL